MRTPSPSRHRRVRTATLGALAALGAMTVSYPAWFAQEPPVQRDEAPAQSEETLRIATEVVNVYAVVRDKNRPVAGLNREDFEVTEDDRPQEIRYFSRETDTPLTMGILIDTSVSQQNVLGVEQQEAKVFVKQVIGKRDLAFVLRFDTEVELLQDLTANHRLLAKAVDSTVINSAAGSAIPGPFPASGGGGTNLHDAVYLSARELLKNEVGRKVVIVLSDGEDTGSQTKLSEALEAAQKSDVIIYAIAVTDRRFYYGRSFGFSGDSILRRYADQTGGRVIEVGRVKDTARAFQEIAEELRTQYSLGYATTNTRRDGSFRKVRVKVKGKDYKVLARRGYYAPTE